MHVRPRSHPGHALEVPIEMRLVVEPAFDCGARRRCACLQQPLCGLDSERPPVGGRRHADLPPERAREMKRAEADRSAQVVEGEVLAPVRVYIGPRGLHRRMSASGRGLDFAPAQSAKLVQHARQNLALLERHLRHGEDSVHRDERARESVVSHDDRRATSAVSGRSFAQPLRVKVEDAVGVAGTTRRLAGVDSPRRDHKRRPGRRCLPSALELESGSSRDDVGKSPRVVDMGRVPVADEGRMQRLDTGQCRRSEEARVFGRRRHEQSRPRRVGPYDAIYRAWTDRPHSPGCDATPWCSGSGEAGSMSSAPTSIGSLLVAPPHPCFPASQGSSGCGSRLRHGSVPS